MAKRTHIDFFVAMGVSSFLVLKIYGKPRHFNLGFSLVLIPILKNHLEGRV